MTTTQVVSILLEAQDHATPTIDMLGATLEKVSSITDKHLTGSGEGQTSVGKVKTNETEGQVSQEDKQDCQGEGKAGGDESSLEENRSSIQENGVDRDNDPV